jgi:hypothetical protein
VKICEKIGINENHSFESYRDMKGLFSDLEEVQVIELCDESLEFLNESYDIIIICRTLTTDVTNITFNLLHHDTKKKQ